MTSNNCLEEGLADMVQHLIHNAFKRILDLYQRLDKQLPGRLFSRQRLIGATALILGPHLSAPSDVVGGATMSQLVFAAISAVGTCGFKQLLRDSRGRNGYYQISA